MAGNLGLGGFSRNLLDVWKDMHSFRQYGTIPIEVWYPAGVINATALTTGAPAVNTLVALPFLSPKGGVIDRLGFNVTTAGSAGSKGRCGIYTAKSDLNLYPDKLIKDSGEFATDSTGVKSATMKLQLLSKRLYWFAYLAGSSAPTVRAGSLGGMYQVFGIDSGMGTAPGFGLTVSFTYGALPFAYPAGGAVLTATPIPIIACRYASA